MNKKIWVIANWKSNKNIAEALEWVSEVGSKLENKENLKVVVCPPFTDIEEVKKSVLVSNFPLMVGSQDLSPFGDGAYTGEESARILKDVVEIAILGHSERRENFNETDEMVAEKVTKAIENNIIPLVCVQGIETPIPEGVKVVAYEPVFAIGTGIPDTPENANKVAGEIKEKYGNELEVLYGGSVNSENCKSFTMEENIDGLLIGKSSLDALEFVKIIKEVGGF